MTKALLFLRSVLLFAFMLHSHEVHAQQNELMSNLVNKHVAINAHKKTMAGYRIQIYSGRERAKATEIKNQFSQLHNDIHSHLIYHQPNFKVRIGDFKTRLEAIKLQQLFRTEFTMCFIVPDEVQIPFTE